VTLGEAEAFNDLDRIHGTEAEIEALTAELTRAVGLGGRDRRAASAVERARVSATRALRSTLQRIRANDEALAGHLDLTIKTGTFCSYAPDPGTPLHWAL
jgi:hypothetical protein